MSDIKEGDVMKMKEIVETFGLTKRYGDFVSVNDLNLTVAEGSIYLLWGLAVYMAFLDQTERASPQH